jgi:hypothetical protein
MTSSPTLRRPIMSLPSDQDNTGRNLGIEELALLEQCVQSGTLTSTKGSLTRTLEERFRMRFWYRCNPSRCSCDRPKPGR